MTPIIAITSCTSILLSFPSCPTCQLANKVLPATDISLSLFLFVSLGTGSIYIIKMVDFMILQREKNSKSYSEEMSVRAYFPFLFFFGFYISKQQVIKKELVCAVRAYNYTRTILGGGRGPKVMALVWI